MKHAHQYAMLFVMVSLLLTHCQFWTLKQKGNDQEIQALSRFLDERSIEWSSLLSPDGQWIAHTPPGQSNSVEVMSIVDPTVTIPENADAITGLGKEYFVWAPDSKKFALASSTEPGICMTDRVVIYHVSENRELIHFVFRLPDHIINCLGWMTWSPDSSILAVTDNLGNIYYLDTQANLIRRFVWREKANIQIYWTERGRFASISKYDEEKKDRISTLIWFEQQGSDAYQTLLQEDFSIGIDGFDPNIERILISVGKTDISENNRLKLLVFELRSKKTIKEITQPGYLFTEEWNPAVPSYVSYLLAVPDIDSGQRKLFLFDWKKLELVDYGPANFLVGWRTNVNGFLVLNGDLRNLSSQVGRPK